MWPCSSHLNDIHATLLITETKWCINRGPMKGTSIQPLRRVEHLCMYWYSMICKIKQLFIPHSFVPFQFVIMSQDYLIHTIFKKAKCKNLKSILGYLIRKDSPSSSITPVLQPGRLQKTDSPNDSLLLIHILLDCKSPEGKGSFLYPTPWAQSRTTFRMCENAGKCITEFHYKWLDFGGGSEENVKIQDRISNCISFIT